MERSLYIPVREFICTPVSHNQNLAELSSTVTHYRLGQMPIIARQARERGAEELGIPCERI